MKQKKRGSRLLTTVPLSPGLKSKIILWKFLFVYILLIINYISFTKLLAQQTCNKNQKNYFPRI